MSDLKDLNSFLNSWRPIKRPFKKEETVESSPWGGVCISEGGVFLWQRIRKSKKFLRQKMAGL